MTTTRQSADTPTSKVEWDAKSYHQLSNPHVVWGEKVLARFPLRGDETVIDAGCGTGRLTAQLLERLPRGHVVAFDRSQNMLDEARAFLSPRFGERVSFVRGDLLEFPEQLVADAIFSTAALHWVLDHPRLFANLFLALRPGGVLVAQCGGAGNIDRLLQRAAVLVTSPPFEPFFAGWRGPWEFATPEVTRARLTEAGFTEIEASLQNEPTRLRDGIEYRAFLERVVFGTHLERIADPASRGSFLDRLTERAAEDVEPFTLDYVRLNLRGRRP